MTFTPARTALTVDMTANCADNALKLDGQNRADFDRLMEKLESGSLEAFMTRAEPMTKHGFGQSFKLKRGKVRMVVGLDGTFALVTGFGLRP
jgi:hypothetical protein